MPNKRAKPSSLIEHARGVERLLGILGYAHLRARALRDSVVIESGPADDPYVHLRLRSAGGDDWRVDVRTHSGRWERTPIVGARGNVIADVHQLFPWLLRHLPEGG